MLDFFLLWFTEHSKRNHKTNERRDAANSACGGTEHNLQLPVVSVENSAKAWAKIDRCAEKPSQTKLPAHEKGGMETKVEIYDGR